MIGSVTKNGRRREMETYDRACHQKRREKKFFFSAHAVHARGSDGHQNVLWSISYSHVVREQVYALRNLEGNKEESPKHRISASCTYIACIFNYIYIYMYIQNATYRSIHTSPRVVVYVSQEMTRHKNIT